MRPRSFTTSPLLTEYFGVGRVHEIARQLRVLKLFPKGQRSISNTVSIPQACIFLYLLAVNSTPVTVRVHLDILSGLNTKSGDRFFKDFITLLQDSKLVARCKEIEVSTGINNPIFAIIRYRNGKEINYNPVPESPVINSCRISGDFLRSFVGQLSADFEATWSSSATTTKNIIKKNISCESLQQLVDASWNLETEKSLITRK